MNVMSLRRIDVLGNRTHPAARDRHVAPVVEALRGVDDRATGYQEVIHRKALPRREGAMIAVPRGESFAPLVEIPRSSIGFALSLQETIAQPSTRFACPYSLVNRFSGR